MKNKEILKEFFDTNDSETEEEYTKRYDEFIELIKEDGTYAGDFELAAAAIALNTKIIVYKNEIKNYTFINEYSNITENNNDTIYLLYKNNNHFNLLIRNNNNKKIEFIHEENIAKFHNKIEKNFCKIKKKRNP